MQSHNNHLLEMTEIKLRRMQDLTKQVKELNAEILMLKNDVMANYFDSPKEFKTARGLVLAEYISYKEMKFSRELFDKDNPGIYDLYKKENIAFRFLLK
jgi:hypothetical protein